MSHLIEKYEKINLVTLFVALFISSMEESLGLNHHSPLINAEKKKEFVLDDAFKIIGFMKCYFILFLNVEFLWAFLVTKD